MFLALLEKIKMKKWNEKWFSIVPFGGGRALEVEFLLAAKFTDCRLDFLTENPSDISFITSDWFGL